MNSDRQRLNAIIFSIAIFTLPLVYSTQTLDAVLAPRFIFLGILLFLSSGLSLKKSNSLFEIPPAVFALFIVVEVLSSLFALNPFESIVPILRDVGLFLLLGFLIPIFRNLPLRPMLIRSLILANLIIGGIGLYQLIASNAFVQHEVVYEIRSTLAHRNLFASALLLSWPFAIYGSYRFSKYWRLISLIAGAHSVFLIIFLESRTSILGLIVFVISFLLISLVERFLNLKVLKIGAGLVTTLIVGFAIVFVVHKVTNTSRDYSYSELKPHTDFQSTSDKTFTIDERIMLWMASWKMIENESLLGVGAGNWKIHFPVYGSDIWRARQGMVQFQRPHNDFIWVWAESGILGLLLYLGLFLIVIYSGLKSLFSEKPIDRTFLKLCLSSIVVYVSIASFSFPRERIFHQFLLVICMAVILSYRHPKISLSRPIVVIGGLVSMAIILVGVEWYRGERLSARLNVFRSMGDWQQLKSAYEKEGELITYKVDPTGIPLRFYYGLAQLNSKELKAAKESFGIAYQYHPHNIHVLNNLGGVNLMMGEAEEAIHYYEKALQISPKYLDGRLNLIAAYFNSQDYGRAFTTTVESEAYFQVEDPDNEAFKMYKLHILRTLSDNYFRNETPSISDSLLLKSYEQFTQTSADEYLTQLKSIINKTTYGKLR